LVTKTILPRASPGLQRKKGQGEEVNNFQVNMGVYAYITSEDAQLCKAKKEGGEWPSHDPNGTGCHLFTEGPNDQAYMKRIIQRRFTRERILKFQN
jgi:hypothetical protein